jgi:peroxiredoxin
MIAEGTVAPMFELPAVVEGGVTRVTLEGYVGDQVVILAFYPGDFNPACTGQTTGLGGLDIFTMQRDVSILAISADSVHSHREFAEEFDLQVPLLADLRGEVAKQYGVAVEDASAGYLTNRAVVVVDLDQRVEYTWMTGDVTVLPEVSALRGAVDGIGDTETAQSAYRGAHARYLEGRRAFTSAVTAFESQEWAMAQRAFTSAHEPFAAASDEFNTAARFAEDDQTAIHYERAEKKAATLQQAAEWLADSASAFASGQRMDGESIHADAKALLERARGIQDPPDPDDIPSPEDPATHVDTTWDSIPRIGDAEGGTSEPGVDATAAEETPTPEDRCKPSGAETKDPTERTAKTADTDVDDAKLAEIAAELENQSEAAKRQEREDSAGDAESIEGELDAEEIELDLADPQADDIEERADRDEDDTNDKNETTETGNLGGTDGDHGVPDSL